MSKRTEWDREKERESPITLLSSPPFSDSFTPFKGFRMNGFSRQIQIANDWSAYLNIYILFLYLYQ